MATTADLSTVTADQRARIIREERDVLLLAWLDNQIRDLLGAEQFLNARIRALGVETMTGDTTEED